MKIGQGIKELRQRCGIYQKDFAKMIGISANALCSLETNKADPSISTLKKIAKALDIPLSIYGRSEIDYNEANAKFFHDLLVSVCKLNEQIKHFVNEPEKMQIVINSSMKLLQ